ncbi:thiamine biosynthesis protein ThiS [Mesobacillus boroniphilus]|uniref:Thiamine biosynthesis protein ThiS n=1 Tax=Mesobacillus boroniphilus TaxID=308892 RepID=A0A944GYT8_9BACI|nr:sulfur carrier protein ThiS [Mesobacillus boroniphilus]MBS8265866.1 thiamine biosynthesis protein ThiS [Mesobacillus boroniphilus]
MDLIINGEKMNIPDTAKTVSGLLNYFQLSDKVLIVELNEAILEKNTHENTLLSDGDRIEIVHFVGGG